MIRLTVIITRIEKHKEKAKELVKQNIDNYLVFNTLAMECFQCVNSAIELGEFVVTNKKLGFPSKYTEIFDILENKRLISKKTLKDMKRLVFLRNLISHEYYEIRQSELTEMAKLLDCIDELIKVAKK